MRVGLKKKCATIAVALIAASFVAPAFADDHDRDHHDRDRYHGRYERHVRHPHPVPYVTYVAPPPVVYAPPPPPPGLNIIIPLQFR